MHFKTIFKKLSFKITGSNATDMCREFGSLCAKKHFNILAVTDKVFSIQPIKQSKNAHSATGYKWMREAK